MVTAEQIEKWRAACDKATPGPWVADPAWGVIGICAYIANSCDIDFIVVARDALPTLLDEVERLRALLREWDAKCQGHCDTESIAEQVEALK